MTFRAADVLSDEGYSSGGRRQDTGDHVDHRALAGAIWADKGMDMTPLQPERYVLGRANAAEMLRYRIYGESLAVSKFAATTDFDFERTEGVCPLLPSNCLI